MRLLCYLCPEAEPVPFLRELAPPCTLFERWSRDGETTVDPAGICKFRLVTFKQVAKLHCFGPFTDLTSPCM